MKLLFTADWQVDAKNLDLCDAMLRELLKIIRRHKVDCVIHCGDVKEGYNPVDVRVVNWTVAGIRKILDVASRMIVLRGNHDRIGMTEELGDWFPALAAAGAETVSSACEIELTKDFRLHCLPYRDTEGQYQDLSGLSIHGRGNTVLIFHGTFAGSKLSPFFTAKDGFDPKKLPPHYLFCFGGHVHYHHWLNARTCYIGSPFCQTWNEVNQRKGYLLLDTEYRDQPMFIESKLPRRFDPLLDGFEESKPSDWSGHTVRIQADVKAGANLKDVEDAIRDCADEKYSGATIVIAFRSEGSRSEVSQILSGEFDESAVVLDMLAEAGLDEEDSHKVAKSLGRILSRGRPLGAGGALRFEKAEGKNFLSFDHVRASYAHSGITLIHGENQDLGGSNGAGKTGYLMLPSVALFGRTMKGQEHDAWTRRNSKGLASVKLAFSIEGKDARIVRTRRPTSLRFWLDGRELTHGKGTRQTQKIIEDTTGLSWDVLANSVYVDQREINLLLHGTDKARQELLSTLLGLSRYREAYEYLKTIEAEVSADLCASDLLVEKLSFRLEYIKEVIAMGEVSLGDLEKESKSRLAKLDLLKLECGDLESFLSALDDDREKIRAREMNTDLRIRGVSARTRKISDLSGKKCPTCTQPVSETVAGEILARLDSRLAKLQARKDTIVADLARIQKRCEIPAKKLRAVQTKIELLSGELHELRGRRREVEQRNKEIEQYRSELHQTRALLEEHKATVEKANHRLRLIRAGLGVVHRDGLPKRISGSICPVLNASAARFADLFCQDKIQVRFFVDDKGALDVAVINDAGGASVKDQSHGEARLASLVVSFAVRSILSGCNLLILDEPGEGLDKWNALRLAKGLSSLAEDFGALFITTHNPFLLGGLECGRRICVTKTGGVSSATVE